MYLWPLFYVFALLVLVAPLALAVWLGWIFRHQDRPPLWAALLPLLTTVGGLLLIMRWKSPGCWWSGPGYWWVDAEY